MRAPLQHNAGRLVCEKKRHQHGLEHQPRAASRTHRKMVLAGRKPAWREDDLGRAYGQPLTCGAADPARRLNRRHVLAHEPRLLAPATNIGDAERLVGDERQRTRVAHDLPASLTFCPVDDDHDFPR